MTTYDNWSEENILNPKTFFEIPMDLFKNILLESSYLFARKFVSNSKIIIDSEMSIDFASTLTNLLA
jgi:hypothetical protein